MLAARIAIESPRRSLQLTADIPSLLPQVSAMDLWGFKKWRRQMRYTQAVAGEKLGLSRGAVQYSESEHRPVPRAVELACLELLRLRKQQPDFGPCDAALFRCSCRR